MLAGAGFDSASRPSTLSDLFARGESFELHGSIARIVSRQTQWIGGQQVSCYVVEYNTPSEVATAEMVRLHSLPGYFCRRKQYFTIKQCVAQVERIRINPCVVVSVMPLPPAMRDAWFTAGAKAVVCPKATPEAGGGSEVMVFLHEFYNLLAERKPVEEALRAAENRVPALMNVFSVHKRRR